MYRLVQFGKQQAEGFRGVGHAAARAHVARELLERAAQVLGGKIGLRFVQGVQKERVLACEARGRRLARVRSER